VSARIPAPIVPTLARRLPERAREVLESVGVAEVDHVGVVDQPVAHRRGQKAAERPRRRLKRSNRGELFRHQLDPLGLEVQHVVNEWIEKCASADRSLCGGANICHLLNRVGWE